MKKNNDPDLWTDILHWHSKYFEFALDMAASLDPHAGNEYVQECRKSAQALKARLLIAEYGAVEVKEND